MKSKFQFVVLSIALGVSCLPAPAGQKVPSKVVAPAKTRLPAPAAAVVRAQSLPTMLSNAEKLDGYRLVRDIEYAPDRKLKGDLYLPATVSPGTKLPAVMIVHGGAWTLGDKSFPGEKDLGERLARHGYAAFSIDYRLIRDGGIYPRSIKDVRDAYSYLLQNADTLGLDRNHFGVMGASVGATMVLLTAYGANGASLAVTPSPTPFVKPAAAVAYAPMTDLRDTEVTWVIRYMDDTPWHSPEIFAEASPITYVKTGCPTLCIHGTDDVTVPFQQSDSFIKALKAAGVDAELAPIPKTRHTPFHEEAGGVREFAFARLIEFFDKRLK